MKCKNNIFAVKPYLILKPGNVTTTEMSHLVIDCEVSGEPLPSVEWIKNMNSRFIDDFRIKVLQIKTDVTKKCLGAMSCQFGNEKQKKFSKPGRPSKNLRALSIFPLPPLSATLIANIS